MVCDFSLSLKNCALVLAAHRQHLLLRLWVLLPLLLGAVPLLQLARAENQEGERAGEVGARQHHENLAPLVKSLLQT